ncbi:hypothetical protein [Methylotenera sp.]|jgi:hypothetical protein|uniref:hypothetical protein n=1 Tax=Methylotenera sp. TaxID=2051956 RepID=UPI002735FF66|nr:hypothetical protein [Methylotenera sp.]MDP3777956.1 hypothetical protein [Methylotenera sp.]
MRNPMFRHLVFAIFSIISFNNAYACLDDKAILQLKANEEAHLISRNVATMTDAIEDKLLSVQVKQLDDTCGVTITYSLPDEDIAEANKLLDSNPAKRIMLAGQGYVLPTETTLIANAGVNLNPLSIKHQDILQSADLGRNRASVELLYATLAQTRAVIIPNTKNTEPWPMSLMDQEKSLCESQYTSDSNQSACTCKTDAISKKVSPRQLRYIKYLQNDPYSSTTSALAIYRDLSEQVNFECKLIKR